MHTGAVPLQERRLYRFAPMRVLHANPGLGSRSRAQPRRHLLARGTHVSLILLLIVMLPLLSVLPRWPCSRPWGH